MKLQYKPVEDNLIRSIYVRRDHQPYLKGDWHFHKEFELIYFLEGHGLRLVGDHISNFQKGELVLLGEWLPHLWRNSIGDCEEGNTDFIVLKFGRELEGVDLFSLPEMVEVKALLLKAQRGIFFSETTLPKIHHLLLALSKSRSLDLLINFLRVLQVLAKEKDYEFLSSPDFVLPKRIPEENRLQKVINFISLNYEKSIGLKDISEVASMTPPAFCRFFKARTNKTFSHFLNEFRINKACQLLINGEKSIKRICFEVGFNSVNNFNRAFRNFKKLTPKEYRSQYQNIRRHHSLSDQLPGVLPSLLN
jgi:AraC-like DNA-binding protein